MSNTANEKANRIVEAMRLARFGTKFTANYLQPRDYYYPLSATDDFMALELLVIDQARLQCEKAVKYISRDKSVFRGRFKQLAAQLYKPRTHPKPLCNAIGDAMERNMTDDEQMAFGLMASHIDEVIQPDIDKLTFTLFNEVGRSGVRQQDAMTAMLSCHIFVLIATHVLERCEKLQRGSHYVLCSNPKDAAARGRSYLLSADDLKRMSGLTMRLLNEIGKGQDFAVPYTQAMETSVTIICNKICDVVNVYNACVEGGINVGRNSDKGLDELVKRLNKRKEEAMKPQSLTTSTLDMAAEKLASKGWKIKKK